MDGWIYGLESLLFIVSPFFVRRTGAPDRAAKCPPRAEELTLDTDAVHPRN